MSRAARQDNSLLQMPPWSNPWLLAAMALSFGLHFVILYVPALAAVFSIVPLSLNEWALVVLFAAPVVLIDEVLKFFGRHYVHRRGPARWRVQAPGVRHMSCIIEVRKFWHAIIAGRHGSHASMRLPLGKCDRCIWLRHAVL